MAFAFMIKPFEQKHLISCDIPLFAGWLTLFKYFLVPKLDCSSSAQNLIDRKCTAFSTTSSLASNGQRMSDRSRTSWSLSRRTWKLNFGVWPPLLSITSGKLVKICFRWGELTLTVFLLKYPTKKPFLTIVTSTPQNSTKMQCFPLSIDQYFYFIKGNILVVALRSRYIRRTNDSCAEIMVVVP